MRTLWQVPCELFASLILGERVYLPRDMDYRGMVIRVGFSSLIMVCRKPSQGQLTLDILSYRHSVRDAKSYIDTLQGQGQRF